MYWRMFGEGVEDGAAEEAEGLQGWWRVFTPPMFVFAAALTAGARWINKFREGMREERIAEELQAIFDRAAQQLDIDWEEFFNVEAMGVREEFVVEGWQAGVGPSLGGFSVQDIQGTGPGLIEVANQQAANLAAEAQLAEMNEALGAAQQGQLDVAEAFAELLSEMEDLRLVGMGEADITGTGPGLIAVADAQMEAAAKVDEITAFLGTHGGQTPGGRNAPSPVNITINAPAVTGKEVIDAMAEAVKIGGPMSRQWIGQ
jgi:hypothetical protein